ncbi:MAG: TatD family hydrolase [Candidatus Aenigmatarchaeota archaeon]|nr:MAG: TatD family hydrolase [Candidatus Aenigmarchaeota archaeon]
MIDIHAHLCFGDYDKDMEQVIARCKEELAGVIVSSARYDEGLKTLSLTSKHPGFLFPTLGFHPTEGGKDPKKITELIKSNSERIVGVGECGMDFHWEHNPEKQQKQKEIFSKFIELAEKLSKPLVIHSWDAENECFEMVKDSKVDVVFHCFSGKRDLANEIVSRGFYISISTQVLFSKNIRKISKDIPMDKLLLETDSPFLSPDKEKDPRNYPWNIKLAAEKIAEIRGISKNEVLEKAKENAIRVFDLKIA